MTGRAIRPGDTRDRHDDHDGHDGHDAASGTRPVDEGRGRTATGPAPDHHEYRTVDPRAVRVALGRSMGHLDLPPVVVEPSIEAREGSETAQVLVDSSPMVARLERLDATRAVLRLATPEAEAAAGDGSAPPTTVVLLGALDETPVDRPGIVRREVVVDGWRIEVELESERRAALRDRARRGRTEAAQGGPTEVHAIIPGRVVSVSVQPGDAVVAAQQLLVVEAMKMQNELRAPREGTVTRVAVAAGENIEVGDLLLVLE